MLILYSVIINVENTDTCDTFFQDSLMNKMLKRSIFQIRNLV